MSLKKVEECKKDKGFKLWDILVYCLLAAAVAAILITTLLLKDKDELRGIIISVDNSQVFAYEFSTGGYTFDGDYCTVEEGDCLVVTVNAHGGYNRVEIDPSSRTVRVTQADCGRGDCTYTPLNPVEIKDNNSVIYCSPHAMSIEPADYNFDFENPNIKI